MSESKYSQQPLWTSVVSGSVGGAVAVVVGYPFETVKVRMQTGRTQRLFSALFKGVSSPLCAVTPSWALMYFSYSFAQSAMDGRVEGAARRGALSGAICGLAVATVTTPFDAVKIAAQNERIGAWEAARRLLRQRSVFHGLSATCVHLCLSQAIFFATYESVLDRLPDASWGGAVAGGAAGVVEWTTCLPTDTVKTRYQAGPVGARYLDVFAATYRSGGFLRGFYRGYLPILCVRFPFFCSLPAVSRLRAVPVNASAYFIIESTNAFLMGAKGRTDSAATGAAVEEEDQQQQQRSTTTTTSTRSTTLAAALSPS